MSSIAERPVPRAPRGFPDRCAEVPRAERALIGRIAAVYEAWGFEPLETPAFEYADALGKFLPDADRPNEGVFALQDDDGQWMALRYDLTAPLARFVAENPDTLPRPYRRWAAGPVWRNEKPGPGRFRQFTQCDADTVGAPGPAADAEMVALALAAYEAAGLAPGEVVLKVNTRRLLDGVMTAGGVDGGQRLVALRAIDKLDRLGVEGVERLLGEGRRDESGDFTKGAGLTPAQIQRLVRFVAVTGGTRRQTLDALAPLVAASEAGRQGLEELAVIDAILGALGIGEDRARFDTTVVRGLEYYTGPVFEAELVGRPEEGGDVARFGSVGGGGRYDDLVSRFRGETVPATGFSVGVSRLLAALETRARARGVAQGPVVVLAMDRDAMAGYFAMAAELRAAGIAAEVYLGASGMKAQMKYADRRGAPAVVIEGSDERARGVVTVKDLALGARLATGIEENAAWRQSRPAQNEVSRNALVDAVRTVLAAAEQGA
jgi:histidyl-tRNA synthetase